MVAATIARSGSSERGKIRSGARGVHQGVQGSGRRLHLLAAEALGLAKSDVVIIEWRQGKFRLVDL